MSNSQAQTKPVTVSLDRATREKLDRIAVEESRSRSQVVRMIVAAHEQREN